MYNDLTKMQSIGSIALCILLVSLIIFMAIPRKPKIDIEITPIIRKYKILFVRREGSYGQYYIEYLKEDNTIVSKTECFSLTIGEESQLIQTVYLEKVIKTGDVWDEIIIENIILTKEDYDKIKDTAVITL